MRHSYYLLLLALLVSLGACDKDDDSSEVVYNAECEVVIGPADWPPIHEARGQAADRDAAYAMAFTQACGLAELGPGCQDALPDGMRTNRVGCVSVTLGTGGTLTAQTASTGFTCTVRVIDERNPVSFAGQATMEGSREETEDLTALCAEAIASACAEAGTEGDCTAGDAPSWQVTSSTEGRMTR